MNGPKGRAWALAALAIGLAYALVSAYWGLGGTWLLDTVGGVFERAGRSGGVQSSSCCGRWSRSRSSPPRCRCWPLRQRAHARLDD